MGVPGSANFLLAGGATGYQIERSLRFNSPDSAYLNRTPASNSDSKTWTWSAWVKRSALATDYMVFSAATSNHSSNPTITYLGFNSSDQFVHYSINNNTLTWNRTTSQVFRDVSAWYHIVCVLDTSNATAGNRARVYVNGTEVTAWATNTTPSQNADGFVNLNNATHKIGQEAIRNRYSFDGYLTEINFIDGQALTPSSFGETDTITGVWKPKRYAGTYGTNGFYLKFADNSGTTATTLGKDSSPNGNNFTPNNFSVTAGAGNDSLIDSPTNYADGGNGRGNYATLNPLWNYASTLSNGNLDWTTSTLYGQSCSSIAVSSGKWYWEINVTSVGMVVGIIDAGKNPTSSLTGSRTYYSANGNKYTDATPSSYGASYTNGDVIGCALDLDNGTLVFYKNNTSQGTAFTGLSGTYYIGFIAADNNFSRSASINFGQRAFAYTPPSGFLALNTNSLPEPSIKKPSSYFDTKLYTGNNGTLTVTGLGFSPDLVWIKNRDVAGTSHVIQDAARGATAYLSSNSTAAENTNTSNNWFRAFTSDGFTVAATTSGGTATSEWNNNGSGYVAWCWDESATPGFDIVTFTGTGATQNISHSLGVAPKMIFVKPRSATGDWWVYHESIGATKVLFLELTDAALTFSGSWNNTAATANVFTVGTAAGLNANGVTHVAYLWSEVAGFSKFGSYTGNGSTDGPFVFCGFRPRWLMTKRTDSSFGGDWYVYDTARDTYNVASALLSANTSNAEGANSAFDLTSNGFKVRSSAANFNASGGTYIFAAFSEFAFKYSLAR